MGVRHHHRHSGPCHAGAAMDHATPINPRDSCRVAIRIAGRAPRCVGHAPCRASGALPHDSGLACMPRKQPVEPMPRFGSAPSIPARRCWRFIRPSSMPPRQTVARMPPRYAWRLMRRGTPQRRVAYPGSSRMPHAHQRNLSAACVAPSASHLTSHSSRPAGIGAILERCGRFILLQSGKPRVNPRQAAYRQRWAAIHQCLTN